MRARLPNGGRCTYNLWKCRLDGEDYSAEVQRAVLKEISNDSDYRAALSALRPFFDRKPEEGTAEALEFDRLAALIEHYEALHFPVTERTA